MTDNKCSPETAELLGNLPLQYEDGPDYCTVTDATGGAFALTVQPELMKAMERALLGAAQRQADRESILKAIIEAQGCGLGDTGPDGKWRRIACNDKSLEGDRNYFHEDCDCSRAADAVLALSSTEGNTK